MEVNITNKQVLDLVLHSKLEKGNFGLESTSWIFIGNTLSKDIITVVEGEIIYNYVPRLMHIGELAEGFMALGC